MNHLLSLIIIILIIFIIIKLLKNFTTETFIDKNNYQTIEYLDPKIIIKKSSKGGRGIFATRDYQEDEVIEVCPIIVQDDTFSGLMRDYLFTFSDRNVDKNKKAVAFGYCSMYNHDDDNNATWSILNPEQMKIIAKKEIKNGDEIFVSYGSGYWNSRKTPKN